MSARRTRLLLVTLLIPAILGLGSIAQALTANEAFDIVWSTTDQAVANGSASYSWFWGPTVNGQRFETYLNSPDEQREVRYYDKSRMEINNPSGDPNNIYYVTNGLLTVELVTGQVKLGDAGDDFEQRQPATQLVAGDPENNTGTPPYAAFGAYVTTDGATNRSTDQTGQSATAFMSGAGQVSSTDSRGVTLAHYENVTGHNIASVFWDWFNSPSSGFRPEIGVNWVYAAGLPISEPFWIDSTVGGNAKRVLVQLFERRVLTYTESNNDPYRIEWGNIGQHYQDWRYEPPALGENISVQPMTEWSGQNDSNINTYVAGDELHVEILNSPYGISRAMPYESNELDVSVQLQMLFVDPNPGMFACLNVGMDLNLLDDPRYRLCIEPSGSASGQYLGPNDEFLTLADSFVADPSGWLELRIDFIGSTLSLYVDGQWIGTADAPLPHGGWVGFEAANLGIDPHAEVAFRSLAVHAIGATTPPGNDTIAPVFSEVPTDVSVLKDLEEASAIVTWTGPVANDAVDGAVGVTCTPPTGSAFPLGVTQVACTATDSAGNTASVSFPVTVRDRVTFVTDGDVSSDDIALIHQGMAMGVTYFTNTLGVTQQIPVILTMSSGGMCGEGSSASLGVICMGIATDSWTQNTTEHRLHTVVHEYFHTLQFEQGCGNGEPTWMIEGFAEFISYVVLDSFDVQDLDVTRDIQIQHLIRDNPPMPPLPEITYQTPQPGAAYHMWFLAAEQLAARRGIGAVVTFCHQLNAGVTWERAFQSSFGATPSQFYTDFEQYREDIDISAP